MTGTPPRARVHPAPPAITSAGPAAIAGWEAFLGDAELMATTRIQYRHRASCFLRWLERRGLCLREVTPAAVAEFLGDQPASAVAGYRAALRRLFEPLVSRAVMPSNPAAQAGKRRRGPASPADAARENHRDELCLDELKAAVRAMDPAIEEDPELFDAGVVLLAGAYLGTRYVMPISRFTGVSARRVAEFAQRLRANGVWTADGRTACNWDDEQAGGVAFLLDVLIAAGLVEQRGDDATPGVAPAVGPDQPPGE